ncbi:MAG: 4Fe-4S binding protein [Desulfobacteraceae bacterium]|uniref:4Fe-4S binding protein n=1 Tax=Candidatus Desulfacyla euxinica TaxID=2841693 RepID=A0A8J6N1P2_9DELT|nr:4Fe-4S binding protein [Candidatus Desulfacyla euxinica]MBL6977643.1 4Fe-4S binding protein [Desulfobacteraceae bacterium]
MDIFEQLARKLDELPEGFPATESGVELKILREIFSPDEAEMALMMRPGPETAEDIAERLGKPVVEMGTLLDDMVRKGQIGSLKMDGRQVYRLVPFVVGIYEYQRGDRLTRELAELFEEYLPLLSKKLGGHGPHLTRVVPINTGIKADLQILQHEDVRQIIEKAKSFRVQDCICRREQALLGNRCEYTLKNCLQYSMEEGAYDYFKLDGDIISKEEALIIIDETEKEGLVHNTYNVEEAIGGFICNCCPCCCGLLRCLKEFNAPYILARSRYVATIDLDSCESCGICRDERCPMDAIVEDDGEYRVEGERCIGCGVCVVTCPSESIILVDRPESDRDEMAENMIDWGKRRLEERGRHAG